MEENLNAIMTVPVAEYKELLRQSIELKYLKEIRELKEAVEEERQRIKEALEEERQRKLFYYDRWEKADGARAEMEAQLKETSKQLHDTQEALRFTQENLNDLEEFYGVKRRKEDA